MQLNVMCWYDSEEEEWVPYTEESIWNKCRLKSADKAYHVSDERIVYLNPRNNIVRIDDGTPEGIVWFLGATSAKEVRRMLDGYGPEEWE